MKEFRIQRHLLKPAFEGLGLEPKEVLRVYHVSGGVGEIVSWPELGDHILDVHEESLRNGNPTPSAKGALDFARRGPQALSDLQLSLSGDSSWPLSLFLGRIESWRHVLDSYSQVIPAFSFKNWRSLKVKMRGLGNVLQLKDLLDFARKSGARVRVDFNFSLSGQEFEGLLNLLGEKSLEQVEFFEDPFIYEWGSWEEYSKKYPIRLALDRQSAEEKNRADSRFEQGTAPFLYVIAKPHIEDSQGLAESAASNMRRWVLTSYMGSRVEALQSLWLARKVFENHPFLIESLGLTPHFLWKDTGIVEPSWQGFEKGFLEGEKITLTAKSL